MSDTNIRLRELFIGSLTIISIILVIAIQVISTSPGWLFTLYTADLIVSFALGWDFVSRLKQAPLKSEFWKYHGFEILAVIPAIIFFSAGPLVLLLILLRSLRLIRVVFITTRPLEPIGPKKCQDRTQVHPRVH
jgi:hypothetical protein